MVTPVAGTHDDGRPRADAATESRGGTLVLCRTLAGLAMLPPFAESAGVRIASDDPRVHAAAAARGVRDCVTIEGSESLFSAAPEVLPILHAINRWLLGSAPRDGVAPALVYWTSHAEGGDTTQRIQDGVLLSRAFLALLDAQTPREAILVRDGAPAWEDSLFLACAAARGVRVRTVGGADLRSRLRALWTYARPLAKEGVFVTRLVRAWWQALRRRPAVPADGAVLIQLCDPATKHVNTVAPLLRALDAEGLPSYVLGWSAAPAIAALGGQGYAAADLEAWVTIGDIIASWWRTARTWRALRSRASSFLADPSLGPTAALLRPVLWPSTRAFVVSEIPHRARLDSACRRFFAQHRVAAARLWTRVLPQGVTAYRAMPSEARPLLFWQPGWPYNVPEPLRDYPVPADLIFALSGAHRELLRAEGVPDSDIVVAGLPWLEMIRAFGAKHSKAESRAVVGVPPSARAVIAFDSGTVLRGYLSPAEQLRQLRALLEVARAWPEMHLLVKPHPSHRVGGLEAALADAGLPNVQYVAPTGPVYHVLNAADLLVTKFSTLAIEGMCLGVPSVAALFDGEPGFRLYEDAVDYATTPTELRALLERAIDAPAPDAQWRRSLADRAAAYVERHALNLSGDPNATIARALRERLTKAR